MGKAKPHRLNFPIFSIISHKEFIIVSGGAGKEFGIANKLAVYRKNTMLTEPVNETDTGKDLIENLNTNGITDLISCNSGRFCIIFSIDDKGVLAEVARFATDTDSQNTSIFNQKGDLLATAGDDSTIKIWKIEKKGNKYEVQLDKEIKSHTGPVTHLDISVDDTMLCSASEDKTCRVFDIKSGAMVKKITFGEDAKSTNLRFSYCFFSRDEKYLYTIQNPSGKGNSYLTAWDIENNLEPFKTIKLHNEAITSACMKHSEEGLFMGVGTVDGGSKIINTRYLEIDCSTVAHDLIVKSVAFVNDSRALASVSADYSFYFLPNVRPEGFFSKMTKLWVAAMFIIYIVMWLNEKFHIY